MRCGHTVALVALHHGCAGAVEVVALVVVEVVVLVVYVGDKLRAEGERRCCKA